MKAGDLSICSSDMKQKIIYIIYFAVAVFFLLFCFEKLYDFFLLQNRNIKTSYITGKKIDADIIYHGPCETLWVISPDIIDKQTKLMSYNLALSHSDFADNYLHLYLYLKNNKAPDYLFLYVTPESFDLRYNTFNTYRFTPFIGDSLVDEILKESDSAYYCWTKIPFIRYAYYNGKFNFNFIQGIKHYITGRELPYFPTGYEPPYKLVWDNRLENITRMYPDGMKFIWNEKRERDLRKLIQLAQHCNVKIFLYESPVLKEAIPYEMNRNEFIERTKKIAADYNTQYLVFDTMEIANSREYFMSVLNTNIRGSEIFNNTFGKYIKEHIIDKKDSL
jgi:hypothetical protein